jgi:condensin-2 complex subunit G2
MTLHSAECLLQEFHRQIKAALPSCRKEVASAYGEIYSWAIKSANPDMMVVRATVSYEYSPQQLALSVEVMCFVWQVIAEVCLRDVILHVLQVPRCSLQMGRMGQQLMRVLRVIHSNRRCVAVTKMLIRAYEPIIWRFVSVTYTFICSARSSGKN